MQSFISNLYTMLFTTSLLLNLCAYLAFTRRYQIAAYLVEPATCQLEHVEEHECDISHICSEWCDKPHVEPAQPDSLLEEWHRLALRYEGDTGNHFATARQLGNMALNTLCHELSTDMNIARSNNMLRAGVLNGLAFANSAGNFYNDTTVGDWCEAALADQTPQTQRAWVVAYLKKIGKYRA